MSWRIFPTFLFGLCSGLAILPALLGFYAYQQLHLPFSATDTIITVRSGDTIREIAYSLARDRLIKNPLPLLLWAKFNPDKARQIKAGEFRVTNASTPRDLMEQMISGTVIHYQVTIPEGVNFREMLAILHQEEKLIKRTKSMNYAQIMADLGHPDQHPEGRFYPSSYQYDNNTSDLDILRQAYALMQKKLAANWQAVSANNPLKTPYQLLIMASIVEKETGLASERAQICGVFLRRLQKKMRLQTDPTVIYGLGDAFTGDLKRIHLRTDNPYNTYTRKGLPPTPIALPGGQALAGCAHPKEGEWLYFVAKGDGSHQFSRTLKAHNAAVKKYQLGQ